VKAAEGWTTGARAAVPNPPPPPPPPLPLYAKTSFDDSTWRTVETPHDWSNEDLPPREEDFDTPASACKPLRAGPPQHAL
jgi:hypothetical protein